MRKIKYIVAIIFCAACGTDDTSKKNITVDTLAASTVRKPANDTSRSSLNPPLDSVVNNPNNEIDWVFNKVQESKLLFKGGQLFETNLYDLKYIGQISGGTSAPYLIFSGRHCTECDANISIYIHSPKDGKLNVDHGQNTYQYPGTERDYETDSILYVSRAFYGEVVEGVEGVIWYEKILLENGKMERSIFLSRIDNGTLKDTTYNDNGQLGETISFLKSGKCREIPGRKYMSEP